MAEPGEPADEPEGEDPRLDAEAADEVLDEDNLPEEVIQAAHEVLAAQRAGGYTRNRDVVNKVKLARGYYATSREGEARGGSELSRRLLP